jgi:hypothetical protein
MTRQEKRRLSAVLRATEYLFLENITLKLVLDLSFSGQNRRGIGADANPVRAFHHPGIHETLTPDVGFAAFNAFHSEDSARDRYISEHTYVQRLWRDLLLLGAGLRD